MNKPAAVLFDMDGVIFDSEPIHERIFIEFSKRLGVSISSADYQRFIGTSSVSQWSYMKDRFGLEGTPQDLSDKKMEFYKKYLKETPGLKPIPGLHDFMDELKSNKIPFALASSNTTDIVEATLNAIGLDRAFPIQVGGNDVTNAKPAPDIFLLAASRLDATPELCVAIEDSTNGILASQRAGMRSIGFDNPNSPGQDLTGATIRISSLKELSLDLVRRMFN